MRLELEQYNLGHEYQITMKLIEKIITLDNHLEFTLKDDEIYES